MSATAMHVAYLLAGAPVALPLAGAALTAGLRKWLSRTVADLLGITVAALALAVDALLLYSALQGGFVAWFGNWFPRGSMVVGIGFVVEPVGAGMAVLAALLTLLALIFSWKEVGSGANYFQPLMLVFLAAMSGFVLTSDIFNLFVFFELMSTAAFALCGLKTAEPAPLQGAFNFAVTNTIAAFLVLSGVGILYAMTGALNMAQIGLALGTRHDPLVLFACTLLTCGFLVKGAIVPFHLWLPDAHAVAPTPVCVLFSGLMVELGLFAVMRLQSVVFGETFISHPSALRNILASFAIATVLLGSVMCYAEHHLKRLLAFSTISHAGLMLLAFSTGGATAVAAMLTYLLAHAFIKSSLFFTSGMMLHRFRSISERVLFRRGRGCWWTAALWFLGGAGLAATPPLMMFIGEAGATHRAESLGFHGVSWIFLFGGAMTAAAVFRVGMHVFFGWGEEPITDRAADVGELPETKDKPRPEFYHFFPPALLLLAAVGLTFWRGWLPVLQHASALVASQAAYAHMLYTGHAPALHSSGWSEDLTGSAARGLLGCALAFLLALTSVFRGMLVRWLRLGAYLEGGIPLLRVMQSGQPGDYVAWLTVGLATFGAAALAFLRR